MISRRWTFIAVMVYGAVSLVLLGLKTLSAGEGRDIIPSAVEESQPLQGRRALRAFYTAPPVIPHEIEKPLDSVDCLRCHAKVTRLDDGRVAMASPHPQYYNCQQCHVQAKMVPSAKEPATSWHGLDEPTRGERGYLISPPTVPHRIYLRENCLSCHGPQNPDMRMRTSHPERSSCLQCHVPDPRHEFTINRD